jgi:hypothetical protein
MPSFVRPLSLVVLSFSTALPLAVACSPADDDDTGGGTGGSSSAGRSAGGMSSSGGAGGAMAGKGGSSASGGTAGQGGGPPQAGTGGAAAGTGGVGGASGAPAGGNAGAGAGTSGQGGTAGSPGQGGGAGTPPLGGNGGGAGAAGGGAGGAPATGFFMDDFESGTTGMQPPGWDNFIAYNKNGMNPSGMTLALVDTTQKHGGTKAVHFHGGSSPAQLVKALDAGMTKLYIRVWVYMTRKLGQQTNNSANHETLIALRSMTGFASNEVRFGEIKGAVGVNEVPTDNISPTMDQWHQATGPVVPADTWVCLEVAFLADSSPNLLKSWLNGTLLYEVTGAGTDQWQNGAMPATWVANHFGGTPSEIVIGWQSFSDATNDVWMDDLVLSTSPIGCN